MIWRGVSDACDQSSSGGSLKSEVIAFASASLFFKTFQIHRAVDTEKKVLV